MAEAKIEVDVTKFDAVREIFGWVYELAQALHEITCTRCGWALKYTLDEVPSCAMCSNARYALRRLSGDKNVMKNAQYHGILVEAEEGKPGISIAYDGIRDVVTIEGVDYSGGLFRAWGHNGLRSGVLFRLERMSDGQPYFYLVPDEPSLFARAWRWVFGRRS